MNSETASQRRSKLLFNNAHMLAIGAEIARTPPPFTSQTLQDALQLGQSTVQRTLRVLEEIALVRRSEREARTAPLEYERIEHPFWETVDDLCGESEALA